MSLENLSSSQRYRAVPGPDTAQWATQFKRWAVPSLVILGGLGGLDLLRKRFVHRRMFVPTRYPDGIWDPNTHGLPIEDVWFQSEDGVPLHGWWIAHPDAQATVIYCHGNSGSIAERVGVLRHLRRLAVNIFAFDYRGYGRSAGEPSERGLFTDVRAAVDWVRTSLQIPLSRVILFGHSLGGAVAIDGALKRPVAGLVVQSSFTQTHDMARHFYPLLPLHLLTRNAFRSIEKVGALALPKLFVHGTADTVVPTHLGKRLYRAASGPKAWLPVPKAGHHDVPRFGGEPYIAAVSRFVRECVPVAG